MTKKIKLSITEEIVQLLNNCKYTGNNSISQYPESWDWSVLQDAVKFGYITARTYPSCYNHTQYTLTNKGKLSIGLK
jgi:hypothetical protein